MEPTIKSLSERFNLSPDFLNDFHNKIVDKENFERAVRMFVDGLMPYAVATGNEPINVAELRHKVATDLWDFRKNKEAKMRAAMEHYKRCQDYYSRCKQVRFPRKGDSYDFVFVRDGHLVAFGRHEPKQGGIYAANNEVMPNWHWQPHEHLAWLRKLNKAFYREIKKAAFNSPREWFDFSGTTR